MKNPIVAYRHGKVIIQVEDGKKQVYTYINEAKRASRAIQKEHGLGSVRLS